ncbi:ubiquitin carboxyl-terminal hydrolase CYLD-like isoform X4 [Halichondria panicea]|uniref:ubiquitin carboxyl-terminal hydrolase CYLD-like isoform X4 n=1 Tax=Halichondria panicea TaxID=6063 RepID=UPI00312B8E47
MFPRGSACVPEPCANGRLVLSWMGTGLRIVGTDHLRDIATLLVSMAMDGYFHPLKNVQPNQSLANDPVPAIIWGNSMPAENPLQDPLEELEEQSTTPPAQVYVGEKRGIQGHYNSSYIDSTIFGLFALSDVFNTMFLAPDKDAPASRQEFKDLLAKKIINPLRKNGVVRFESVMELTRMIEDLKRQQQPSSEST